jgi:hypothetical protein
MTAPMPQSRPGAPWPSPLPPPNVAPETLGLADDLVAQALHTLGQFGELNLHEARILLDKWARRDELSDEQHAEVLAYYRPFSSRLALAFDGGAWTWTR